MTITKVLLICIVLVSCSYIPAITPTPENPQLTNVVESPAPRLAGKPSPSSLPAKTQWVVTPSPLPDGESTPPSSPQVHEAPGALYDTVVKIPVGEKGILYRGAGVVDMEPVGPNGIVVTPDGVIMIGDVYGNRLIRHDLAGRRLDDIDLTPLDILNISDLIGINDWLFILEISFKTLPERYRVNQLTTGGELVYQYNLPKGFHFEDGLFGLAVGYPSAGNPRALIDMVEDGVHVYYNLPDSSQSVPERLPGLPVYGQEMVSQDASEGGVAALRIGSQEFESRMTAGGSISLLAAREDGSLYLRREDLVSWEPITTDITIHYVTPEGNLTGVARYPLMDWYFHIWRFLTVGSDGNVYGLITREETVDILRLNFYNRLDPILQGAYEPKITITEVSVSGGITPTP